MFVRCCGCVWVGGCGGELVLVERGWWWCRIDGVGVSAVSLSPASCGGVIVDVGVRAGCFSRVEVVDMSSLAEVSLF